MAKRAFVDAELQDYGTSCPIELWCGDRAVMLNADQAETLGRKLMKEARAARKLHAEQQERAREAGVNQRSAW